MAVNYSVIIAYAFGIILLFVVGRLLLVPIKVVLKLVFNGLLGALAIILINLVGGLAGFHIGLNVVTAFIVGILGIPGLLFLILLKLIFNVW